MRSNTLLDRKERGCGPEFFYEMASGGLYSFIYGTKMVTGCPRPNKVAIFVVLD